MDLLGQVVQAKMAAWDWCIQSTAFTLSVPHIISSPHSAASLPCSWPPPRHVLHQCPGPISPPPAINRCISVTVHVRVRVYRFYLWTGLVPAHKECKLLSPGPRCPASVGVQYPILKRGGNGRSNWGSCGCQSMEFRVLVAKEGVCCCVQMPGNVAGGGGELVCGRDEEQTACQVCECLMAGRS